MQHAKSLQIWLLRGQTHGNIEVKYWCLLVGTFILHSHTGWFHNPKTKKQNIEMKGAAVELKPVTASHNYNIPFGPITLRIPGRTLYLHGQIKCNLPTFTFRVTSRANLRCFLWDFGEGYGYFRWSAVKISHPCSVVRECSEKISHSTVLGYIKVVWTMSMST